MHHEQEWLCDSDRCGGYLRRALFFVFFQGVVEFANVQQFIASIVVLLDCVAPMQVSKWIREACDPTDPVLLILLINCEELGREVEVSIL